MRAFFLLVLVAVAFCQVPEAPSEPAMSCTDAIAKFCPNLTGLQCLQCTTKNRAQILEVSDCTRQELEKGCGITVNTCNPTLQKTCQSVRGQGDSCFQCTQKNAASLDDAGCTNNQISRFCGGSTNTSNCNAYLAKLCGSMQHQGDACVNCTTTNAAMLRDAGCTMYLEEQFCQAGPVPNPPSDQTCGQALVELCESMKGSGPNCYQCVFKNYANVTKSGCTATDLHNFCGTGNQTEGCPNALTKLCGTYKGQHYYCFQCVVTNNDDLKAAGCTVDNFDSYCEGAIGNNCTRTLQQFCKGDRGQGDVCSKCVESNQDPVDAAGCTDQDIDNFCDPPNPVPQSGPVVINNLDGKHTKINY